MEFIPYKAHECFEHLYYQIPMELFFNKKYKDNLNSDKTVTKAFKQLKDCKLIYEKRRLLLSKFSRFS